MTGSATQTVSTSNLPNQHLIADSLWTRLVQRVVRDENIDTYTSGRIINEALGFLKYLAETDGPTVAPSELVDVGWHTFILYTREYAAFCDRYARRFIHHEPNDNAAAALALAPRRTAELMVQAGYNVDSALWQSNGADIGGCGYNPSCSACTAVPD